MDPNYRRPYTDEYTGALDRDLGGALKLSIVATYRREKYPTATLNPAAPFATTLSTRADTGPDGVAGTADDSTLSYYNRLSATNLTVVTNDPTYLQSYKGVEITGTKRMSNRWQMVAGLDAGEDGGLRSQRQHHAEQPAERHGPGHERDWSRHRTDRRSSASSN